MPLVPEAFFGRGLGNSIQKLGSVPEAQNDMIFSIICEELGIFGGIIVLLLYAYLLYRLIFYCAECTGYVWVSDGQRYFYPHCAAGYPEYCGCGKPDAEHR